MSGLSTPSIRQFLALLILLLLVGSGVSLAMQTVIALPRSRSAEIAALAEQLADVQSGFGREILLRERQRSASAELQSLAAFWSGPSRTQIAAIMQDVLRSAAQQAGGQVISSSVLEHDPSGQTLSVRARITGVLATLQHVLSTVQSARPRLFVDSLVVTAASGASTSTHQQELSFELSTSGYLVPKDIAVHDLAKP